MELTREQWANVEDAMADYDYDEYQMREDYSGRGMYGANCIGIVCGNVSGAVAVMVTLAEVLCPDLDDQKQFIIDISREMRSDSMGFDMIYYFPGWTVASK